jgi:hypothetical protein
MKVKSDKGVAATTRCSHNRAVIEAVITDHRQILLNNCDGKYYNATACRID